jgi:hypothetical protein
VDFLEDNILEEKLDSILAEDIDKLGVSYQNTAVITALKEFCYKKG